MTVVGGVLDVATECYGCFSSAAGAYNGYQAGGGVGLIVGAFAGYYAGYYGALNPANEFGVINWQSVGIQAALGCAGASAAGGSCGRGAISGAVGSIGSSYSYIGAIIGGCASSAVGGGSCRDGAYGAAIMMAVGYIVRSQQGQPSGGGDDDANLEGGYGQGGARDRRVYAAEGGEVETLGWENGNDLKQGYGFRLKLRADGDGSLFVYGHVAPSSLTVMKGEEVMQGQYLGMYADPTNGSATGPHLHFEWWSATGVRLDPSAYRSIVMPNYLQTDAIRFRGVHPVKHTPNWHNGYDLVGPQISPMQQLFLMLWRLAQ